MVPDFQPTHSKQLSYWRYSIDFQSDSAFWLVSSRGSAGFSFACLLVCFFFLIWFGLGCLVSFGCLFGFGVVLYGLLGLFEVG